MGLESSIRLLYCCGRMLSQSFLVATVNALNQDGAWYDDEMEIVSPLDSDNNASVEKASDGVLNYRSTFVSKHGVAICLNDPPNRSSPSETLDCRGRTSFLLQPMSETCGRAHSPKGLDLSYFRKFYSPVMYITKQDQVATSLDVCST